MYRSEAFFAIHAPEALELATVPAIDGEWRPVALAPTVIANGPRRTNILCETQEP